MKSTYLFFLVIFCVSCISKDNKSYSKGKDLALKHCASCHTFTEPSLLPKHIWEESVLPNMAVRLGIGDSYEFLSKYPNEELSKLLELNILPKESTLKKEEFRLISEFYMSNAPDTLSTNNKRVKEPLKNYKVVPLSIKADRVIALDTFNKSIAISTQYPTEVKYFYKGSLRSSGNYFESPIVQNDIVNKDTVQLLIGTLDPSELSKGALFLNGETLLAELQRPVFFESADINSDGINDWLIGNFGNEQGNLSWYDGKTKEAHLLYSSAGCRKAYVGDFNKDGFMDIVALFAQAREKIVFFEGDNSGVFTASTLLNFPPVHGSSYFEVVDINNDGLFDIVMTNGDNADLSQTFKPYHGLRVFENTGSFIFKEVFFYPINGASVVNCADLDGDGDLDINVISFFPNTQSNEGFISFENKGNYSFISRTVEGVSQYSWLTMISDDIDADGDEDIVLGGYSRTISSVSVASKKRPSLIYLENKKY